MIGFRLGLNVGLGLPGKILMATAPSASGQLLAPLHKILSQVCVWCCES